MVRGIGIDMARISEFARYTDGLAEKEERELDAFLTRGFTTGELALARGRHNPAEFLAGRFAVKEAAFKALAPLVPGGFDFRIVETLIREDGSPYVSVGPELAAVLEQTGARELLVSITNEGDYAVAMVLAQ